MIRHPPQGHGSRRIGGDRENKLELPDERPPGDVDHHPCSQRLTPGATLEDLDVSDDVGAPFRIAIDRGDQSKALLERRDDLRGRFSMKFS